MKKILVVDNSDYSNKIKNIFEKNGYDVVICDSAFGAISKLRAFDFDLLVTEVDLPGSNSFELYEYIKEHYPYIPIIMLTEKNIDSLFSNIISRGIGNVLHKPLNETEFIKLSEKLINLENIFGLENYLPDISQMKRIRITKSAQIKKAVIIAIETIKSWGFTIRSETTLNLMLNEMAINAVYHSHGLTEEKLKRIPVVLQEDKFVDIHFGHNKKSFAISITDYNGKLTKERILESIHNVIKQNELMDRCLQTGEDFTEFISESGRGIDLVRKLAGEYYFIIKRDFKTEIILVFQDNESTTPGFSSLKIIEDRSHF
ncbi:MAG TPA: response regulator [Spirochaetota bacterium]|nr:response regulator [Spirochaetota bacterium]HOK91813.1 response regulator [Spirochaetota bacterium]HON17098.1 response regulator [Spirochaetota bacterium]HPD77289.1 response regulator [Spirochaetota bacterium]HRS62113.1 response regulator [Spirochaetota bacterium]